jgi:hypothetical protein
MPNPGSTRSSATGARPQPRPRRADTAVEPVVDQPPPARLPVSEFLYDRAGAASPFGDDVTFPLPVGQLSYRHE